MEMAKITLNEVEYDTEDFNPEQMQIYNEIAGLNTEAQRFNYLSQLCSDRRNFLGNALSDLIKQVEDGTYKTPEERAAAAEASKEE